MSTREGLSGRYSLVLRAALALVFVACSSPVGSQGSATGGKPSDTGGTSSGGAVGSGGSSGAAGSGGAVGGSGGASGSGGKTGTGGASGSGGATGSGGVTGTGGAAGSGGATSSGGAGGTGGARDGGGATGTGGATGSGGVTGTGGVSTGGVKGTGDATGTGGTQGTGGASGTGGTTGTGGTLGTGGTQASGTGGVSGTGGQTSPSAPYMPAFIIGADISRVQQSEDSGTKFKDVDGTTPSGTTSTGGGLLTILKNHGFNYVRLRTFVNPAASGGYSSTGYCDLAHTIKFAAGVKQAGMGLLLDFHYSDTWAAPTTSNPRRHGLGHSVASLPRGQAAGSTPATTRI